MELSILLVQQIAVLFVIAFIGYLLVKKNVLKEDDSKVLSWMAAYVLSPCMIVNSFQIDYTTEKLKGLLIAIIAALLIHVFQISTSKAIAKPLHLTKLERASVIYSNSGYLIVPLVTFMLGDEWVFYCCAYIMVTDVFMWTHLDSLVSGRSMKGNWKEILLNPNIIAILLGIVIFFTGFRFPNVVQASVAGLGNSIGAISMFVVGMLIGNKDLAEVFAAKKAYLISLLRLVIFPLVIATALALAVRMGIHPDAEKILLVSLLAACAPVAVMVTQLCIIHDENPRYASIINVMSVLFCIVTMPLIVLYYEILCAL